jgi:hypothetical protein
MHQGSRNETISSLYLVFIPIVPKTEENGLTHFLHNLTAPKLAVVPEILRKSNTYKAISAPVAFLSGKIAEFVLPN